MCERTPKDWSEGIMGGPPWDSKDLTADQNRRYRSFTEKGVFIPTAHGGPKVNFTLISLKVKVFSSAIGSQWSVGGRERLNPPLHGRYPRGGARGLLLKEGFWVWFF